MFFISAFYVFFYLTLIFLSIPLSRIRDFHTRCSFAERNAASIFVCIVYAVFRCIYYIVYIPYNGTKIFFSVLCTIPAFLHLFSCMTYILQHSLALPAAWIEGKIHGKTGRRCVCRRSNGKRGSRSRGQGT